jgi:hypothetical protein
MKAFVPEEPTKQYVLTQKRLAFSPILAAAIAFAASTD